MRFVGDRATVAIITGVNVYPFVRTCKKNVNYFLGKYFPGIVWKPKYQYVRLCTMAKERYNFRLNGDLMRHVKVQAVKNNKNLTEYVEKALKKISRFKEKELV